MYEEKNVVQKIKVVNDTAKKKLYCFVLCFKITFFILISLKNGIDLVKLIVLFLRMTLQM